MGPQASNKNFFGIAVSQPGIDVNTASLSQMLYTNNYSTTTLRDSKCKVQLQEGLIGTNQYGLSAGGGSVVLDASGLSAGGGSVTLNASGLTAGNGSVVLNTSGLSINSSTSSNGVAITNDNLIYSLNSTPQIIIVILPDGTVGIVQSIAGVNVNTIFS